MKPLLGDHRHKLLISGDELDELKKHAYSMAEAYGLDRKIESYVGTRPITLYRWDLECLMDVIDLALKDAKFLTENESERAEALLALLKEHSGRDLGDYRRASGHKTRRAAFYQELDWLAGNGVNFLVAQDWADPDRQVKDDESWRLCGGVQVTPIPGITWPTCLSTSPSTRSTPSGRATLATADAACVRRRGPC